MLGFFALVALWAAAAEDPSFFIAILSETVIIGKDACRTYEESKD